jgi:hypothetical protein
MKKNISRLITTIVILFSLFSSTSCDDYLNVLPKGSKIPKTLADFEAFLRDEYSNQTTNVEQAIILLNDRYVTVANLNYYHFRKQIIIGMKLQTG